MYSNLSELHKVLSKSLSALKGFQVPKSRKFNAKECFFDIKFDQIHGEVKDIRRDPLKTPRGHRVVEKQAGQSDGLMVPTKKRSSSCDEADFKVIEFYSPTYLASVMLKQSASKSEENILKHALLEKSNDFSLLPHLPNRSPFLEELKAIQNDSLYSSTSKVSGMSMLNNGFSHRSESHRQSIKSSGRHEAHIKSSDSSDEDPHSNKFGKPNNVFERRQMNLLMAQDLDNLGDIRNVDSNGFMEVRPSSGSERSGHFGEEEKKVFEPLRAVSLTHQRLQPSQIDLPVEQAAINRPVTSNSSVSDDSNVHNRIGSVNRRHHLQRRSPASGENQHRAHSENEENKDD